LQNITGQLVIADAPASNPGILPQVQVQGWEPAGDFVADTTSDTCEIDPDMNEVGEITLLDDDEDE
jgi:hypothetical protein